MNRSQWRAISFAGDCSVLSDHRVGDHDWASDRLRGSPRSPAPWSHGALKSSSGSVCPQGAFAAGCRQGTEAIYCTGEGANRFRTSQKRPDMRLRRPHHWRIVCGDGDAHFYPLRPDRGAGLPSSIDAGRGDDRERGGRPAPPPGLPSTTWHGGETCRQAGSGGRGASCARDSRNSSGDSRCSREDARASRARGMMRAIVRCADGRRAPRRQ